MKALIYLLFGLPVLLSAQRNYTEALQQGQAATQKGDYETALKKYRAAQAFDPGKRTVVDQEIDQAFSGMRRQRDEALKAKERAERAEQVAKDLVVKVQVEKQKALLEKERAQAAEQKSQAVLDKIYFYNDRFGLAYDKNAATYGFIDKSLAVKIPFQYSEAQPFDDTGYARVKKDELYYLIDTLGLEYQLATKAEQLKSTITALDLRHQALKEIPAAVFENIQLKVLLLGNNQVHNLPEEVGVLTALQALDLDENQLDSLPLGITKLSNLQTLHLNRNHLTSLPAEIGRLSSLQSLHVWDNELSTLPADLGKLHKLQSLNLSSNQLVGLPAEIGRLHKLQLLDLQFNQIRRLPIEIGQLTDLRNLYLQSNYLTSLPASIGRLVHLQSLYVWQNHLDSLPVEIGNLTSLQLLDLTGNRLTRLPAEIGKLATLQTLYLGGLLGGNKLSGLPVEIESLTALTLLDLRGNPIPAAVSQALRQKMPWCRINASLIVTEISQQYSAICTQYEIALQTNASDSLKAAAAETYNSLAWYQLLAGQFSQAEQSVRRGLELDSNNTYLHTNLPPALLLQGKTAEARVLYLDWKDKMFQVSELSTYKDAFLDDFATFEKANLIPFERATDVAAIKKLLRE